MKHGNIVKYAGFLGFTALILIFSGCFLSAPTGELVSPTIRAIGLPDASIVGSVTLKVTGPDMAPVEVSYTQLPSVINIAVPEGNDRKFELTVTMGSSYTGAIASYKGTATAEVKSKSATVTLNMGIGSTKIIVPDPHWNFDSDPRVLQFDDINGQSKAAFTGTELGVVSGNPGWSSNFYPYDIDFDNEGRIYIANNNAVSGYGRVVRVDNILGFGFFKYKDWATGIVALTVDRNRNILYYATSGNLYNSEIDGTNDVVRNLPVVGASSISSISCLAVDSSGMLYMIADVGQVSVDYQVLKLDPLSDPADIFLVSQSGTLPGNSAIEPKDLLVKGNSLYIANVGGGNGYQILQLGTANLSLLANYGDQASGVNTSKGYFYGPRRFAAQMNDEFTILDDSPNFDKIIQMDDISGTNWKTYPAGSDAGQNDFFFYDFGGQ